MTFEPGPQRHEPAPSIEPSRPSIGILGTGSYLPAHVVTNEEIGATAGVSNEAIVRKTAIHTRRRAGDDEATSDLAAHAARAAMARAGIGVDDLSCIVVATSTPDSPQPPTASHVADLLGAADGIAAFDMNAVCSGFVFALSVARDLLAGAGGHGLVIGADLYSRILDPADRRTAILFGDGAGAVVVGPAAPGRGVIATRLLSFPREKDLIWVAAGGSRAPASPRTLENGMHYFAMKGRAVSEFVLAGLPKAIHAFLDDAGVQDKEVDHLILHQANGMMLEQLKDLVHLPAAEWHATVRDFGNTASASTAITLDHAVRADAIGQGDLVLLAAFGGGMSIGLALIRW
ncbi:MAG TPA: ketoacyl-ACP synthase III [Streptosporangiaceae bacterium]